MSNLRNITFGNNDPLLQYSGNWFLPGTYNASNVGETGTLSSTSDLNAKVTFVFPEPVVAFYYYGIPRCCGGLYGICIDCDPNNPNYITIDAVNRTDDGHNPPVVLFSKTFSTQTMHQIIIENQNDTRFGKSQLTLASIVLEVDTSSVGTSIASGTTTSNAPPSATSNSGSSGSGTSTSSTPGSAAFPFGSDTSGTVTATSSSSGSAPSGSSSTGTALGNETSSSSSSHTPLGAIVGGVLAALAFFLFVIILAFWIRLRRRRDAAAAAAPTTSQVHNNNNNNNRTPPLSTAAIHPFNHTPQSPFMTASETATPATTISHGYGVGKHSRPLAGGTGQSVSTFSDATGLSSSSGPTTGGSGSHTGSGSGSGRRIREVDGGPVYNSVLPEEDTLPPDYRDVFGARSSTRRSAHSTNRAMSETSSSSAAAARGDTSTSATTGQMDLSPVRRKS